MTCLFFCLEYFSAGCSTRPYFLWITLSEKSLYPWDCGSQKYYSELRNCCTSDNHESLIYVIFLIHHAKYTVFVCYTSSLISKVVSQWLPPITSWHLWFIIREYISPCYGFMRLSFAGSLSRISYYCWRTMFIFAACHSYKYSLVIILVQTPNWFLIDCLLQKSEP